MPSRCSWATATARSPKAPRSRSARRSPSTLSMSLVAGDFRNNGLTDLAVASTDPLRRYPRRASGQRRRDLPGPPAPMRSPSVSASIPLRLSRETSPTTASSTWPPPMATASGTDDYSVYLGNGDGTFQPPTPYALGGSGGSSTAIATGDFAGNGRTDLAITRTSPDERAGAAQQRRRHVLRARRWSTSSVPRRPWSPT